MAPKRRDASEFGVHYQSPKKAKADVGELNQTLIPVSKVWVREVKGGLATFQLQDEGGAQAFKGLLKKVKATAPALVDKEAGWSVMTQWRITWGTHATQWVHTLQIPMLPQLEFLVKRKKLLDMLRATSLSAKSMKTLGSGTLSSSFLSLLSVLPLRSMTIACMPGATSGPLSTLLLPSPFLMSLETRPRTSWRRWRATNCTSL